MNRPFKRLKRARAADHAVQLIKKASSPQRPVSINEPEEARPGSDQQR
ncbi:MULTISPECIES: hypothetical protein [Prochlorococcus]|nr:hypothetical protein [Prochlorococcus marinus]